MKIQCDVCNKDEASVYCSADEAALCDSCDYGVHHANKLASKHYRFDLVTPSDKETPNCDICQEKRAFLFCRQDRAILCRDCDASIHAANEHTKKHERFLLTGVKLSAKAGLYVLPQNSSLAGGCDLVPDIKLQPCGAKKTVAESQSVQKTTSCVSVAAKSGSCASSQTDDLGLTSSISEYLMETLPGWRVDDLLDSSSAPYGFSKQFDDSLLLPFMDSDAPGLNDLMGSFLPEDTNMWASQVPSISTTFPHYHPSYTQVASKQTTSTKGNNNSVKLLIDDGFIVPQIMSPQSSVGFKRTRLI
ncbi:unnamed protein product [Rhodiola kirilowii]